MEPRVTLDQWRALVSVVDAGGYAQAAEALHKSQSAISYAVHKLEEQLGTKALEVHGRKAELTRAGELMVRRARQLLAEAGELEDASRRLAEGWEAEVRLAVDHLFPVGRLFAALDAFSQQAPHTRVELIETVLSGNEDALMEGQADLAVTPIVPVGFLGDPLTTIRFIAVAHPDHALHRLARELTYRDLRPHRQIVIRDSGRRRRDAGWLGAEQRWTVSHMSTSIRAVQQGLGFAWFPEHVIADALERGQLKPLPLREGASRHAELMLVYADCDYAGRATRTLAGLLRDGEDKAP